MNVDIEDLIVNGFLFDSNYARAVIPYYKSDWIVSVPHKTLIKGIIAYYKRYNKSPTKEALLVLLNNAKINESVYNDTKLLLSNVSDDNIQDTQWLIDTTEDYFKDRAVDIALSKSIEIFEDKENRDRSIIRKYLEEGLSVSFTTNLGIDYADHVLKYNHYISTEVRLPFIWGIWNDITNGGITRQTINAIMGLAGAGKTIVLTNIAAQYYLQGYNVLYISLEMSKEQISQRIDANIGQIRMNDIPHMECELYTSHITSSITNAANDLNTVVGKLIINQFPTSSLTPTKLRHYLEELRLKQGFEPDVLVLDYINLMIPERGGIKAGSYENIKTLAEDNRRLAIEYNYACFTATQINRNGVGKEDVDMSNISESMGLAHTLDFLMAIFGSEQLKIPNVMKFKQLKSRYGDKDYKNQFVMGLNKDMMRLYEIDQFQDTHTYTEGDSEEFIPSYKK